MVGRLALLRARYTHVIIPPGVHAELDALAHPDGRRRIAGALNEGWLVIEPLRDARLAAEFRDAVDLGEAEAIALALQFEAAVLLIDDRKARLLAQRHGLQVSGIIGLSAWAKDHRMIESVSAEMVRLVTEARFFIHPALQAHIRRVAGED